MPAVATDTHAAVWYFHHDVRLSPGGAKAFHDASAIGDPILLPSICLVELAYLIEKRRVPPEARDRLLRLLALSDGPLELVPLDLRVAAALETIERKSRPRSAGSRYRGNGPLPRGASGHG